MNPDEENINKVISAVGSFLNKEQPKASADNLNRTDKENFLEDEESIDFEQWKIFFNKIPMPVFIKDRKHRWIIFNEGLCQFQNKEKEELQNKNDYDFFPKEQADKFWEEEEQIFKTGKEKYTETYSFVNGVEYYSLVKKILITTESGKKYIVGCHFDITLRKKAEQALIDNERRFRSLVQHSTDIIAIIEKDYTIKFITPSFYRLFELSESEVISKKITKFIVEDDLSEFQTNMSKALNSNKIIYFEFRMRKKDNEVLILESSFKNLYFDPAIKGIVMNSTNVTKLKNQAIQISNINKILEQDNSNLQINLKHELEARVYLEPLSFENFKKLYPDNESCFKYLYELKWNRGFICKKCNNSKSSTKKTYLSERCSICGYNESVTANTIFCSLKFPILNAFYILFLVRTNNKISAKELSTLTGLVYNTCYLFKKKILKTIFKNNKLVLDWEKSIINQDINKKKKRKDVI